MKGHVAAGSATSAGSATEEGASRTVDRSKKKKESGQFDKMSSYVATNEAINDFLRNYDEVWKVLYYIVQTSPLTVTPSGHEKSVNVSGEVCR